MRWTRDKARWSDLGFRSGQFSLVNCLSVQPYCAARTAFSSKKVGCSFMKIKQRALLERERQIERRWQPGTRTHSTSAEIRAAVARHRVIKCLKRHREHYILCWVCVYVCLWWATTGVTRGGAETQDTRWMRDPSVCTLRFISGELDLKQTRIVYLLPGRGVRCVF
jgi:hypothetical protein